MHYEYFSCEFDPCLQFLNAGFFHNVLEIKQIQCIVRSDEFCNDSAFTCLLNFYTEYERKVC